MDGIGPGDFWFTTFFFLFFFRLLLGSFRFLLAYPQFSSPLRSCLFIENLIPPFLLPKLKLSSSWSGWKHARINLL